MALPVGGGLGGVILTLILAAVFGPQVLGGGGGGSGVDVGPRLEPIPRMPGAQQGEGTLDGAPDPDAELYDFIAFLTNDVQSSWEEQFRLAGQQYQETTLVVFDEATTSGCGPASSATGPFYCPLDQGVYLDLGFFRDLATRFSAPGDFAQAYVVAHEFGHHVQYLLGISEQVRSAQRADPQRANELSVRLELQADCLAGVWGYSAYEEGRLDATDIDEALAAAAAVGDDRIQSQSGGGVNPEAWTHGSAAQRGDWFRRGLASGDLNDCDTFSGQL